MKIFSLSRIEKLKLIGQSIRAATGVVGGSLILSEAKPYLTIAILAIGAVSNEIVSFIKEKENKMEMEAQGNVPVPVSAIVNPVAPITPNEKEPEI